MTHNEQCQRHVRLLANRLFGLVSAKRLNESAVFMLLRGYVDSPAFSLMDKRALIEDAYAIHHLPSPYDLA